MRPLWALLLAVPIGMSSRAEVNPEYSVAWIGNSFSGAQRWVQQDISDLFVTPDGTIYTNVYWDEAGAEVSVYRNGEVIAVAGHTHGWGYHGGNAIAVNSRYVYFGQQVENEGGGLVGADTWPPAGFVWYGVGRRPRERLQEPAPFPDGKGGRGDTLEKSFLLIHQVPEEHEPDPVAIAGLWATEERLYVSCPYDDRIRVYDAETMRPLFSWPVSRPGALWMDSEGVLWVVQRASEMEPAQVSAYTADGLPDMRRVLLPEGVVPGDLWGDEKGHLYLSDLGPAQQIHVYDVSRAPSRLVESLGERGGIYAPPTGRVGPWRFHDPKGVGLDAEGNLYVASDGSTGGGGTVLECYGPDRSLRWQLLGIHFVDCADLDLRSEEDVYTKEEHLRVDWDAPEGLSWEYRGFTVDRYRYPQDPRLHVWSAGGQVRWIGGRRFLVVNTMHMETLLQLYRFPDDPETETVIPSVLFSARRQDRDGWPPHQPERGEWLWRDANGNGAFDPDEYATRGGEDSPATWAIEIDARGDLWQATQREGIRRFRFQGLDAAGNPIWNYEQMETYPPPAPFTDIRRLYYEPETDTLFLAGWTPEHPYDGHWKEAGKVVARYDRWSTPERSLRWTILSPWDAEADPAVVIQSVCVAGDFVFLGETFRGGFLHVYDRETGEHLLDMHPPETIGRIGWVDIPYGYRAVRRSNGEYVIFVEDDWKAKILVYRWKP